MAVLIYPKCNEIVAHLPGVAAAVASEARKGGARAKTIHGLHRDTGASFINVTHGRVDSYINLNDERGDHAAGAIEAETGALGGAF